MDDVRDIDRRMALAREWDGLVDQVRAIGGFEDFLRPPRLETLLPAAADGPVVIINVGRWRCDALIVRSVGVEAVELPNLTQDSVGAQVQAYLDAVGGRQARARGPRDLDAEEADEAAEPTEAALTACLRWMWTSFAEPILDRLGYTATPTGDWPRVWWCPTGPLTLLPIHAAGDHQRPGQAVLDRVISSYTPTLRALLEARASAPGKGAGSPGEGASSPGEGAGPPEKAKDKDQDKNGRMLFVGMPTTEGLPDLPNVTVEQRQVERLFAGRHTRRTAATATRAGILGDLLTHDWVHFACHGEQNLADPSRGGVIVHDGPLTVTDLSSQQYRGEFAYLSGCKTAVGGVNLPDEAITLAAALHYTGYRHVIATLWSVWDEEAAQVAGGVYEALVEEGGPRADGAAAALHRAVRQLRERNRDRPSVWTPFAHTGP